MYRYLSETSVIGRPSEFFVTYKCLNQMPILFDGLAASFEVWLIISAVICLTLLYILPGIQIDCMVAAEKVFNFVDPVSFSNDRDQYLTVFNPFL
jgi:hypothetical protein